MTVNELLQGAKEVEIDFKDACKKCQITDEGEIIPCKDHPIP